MSERQPVEGRRSDTDRRSLVTIVTMVTGIVLVALVGPKVVDGVSNRLEQPDVESLAATADPVTTDPGTSDAPGGSADSTTTDSTGPVATTEPPTIDPTTTETDPAVGDPVAPAAAGDEVAEDVVPLQTIQLVPALRDVIVDIGGREYVSDSTGSIAVGSADQDAMFEFVGVRAVPSLRDVAFGRWADGSPNSERALSEIDGPVTQVGVVLSHRVTVSTQETVPERARVVFESAAGRVRLAVGRTAWVPAVRAVETPAGLASEQLTYESEQLVVGDDVSEISGQDFDPTPEALWVAGVST